MKILCFFVSVMISTNAFAASAPEFMEFYNVLCMPEDKFLKLPILDFSSTRNSTEATKYHKFLVQCRHLISDMLVSGYKATTNYTRAAGFTIETAVVVKESCEYVLYYKDELNSIGCYSSKARNVIKTTPADLIPKCTGMLNRGAILPM